jgi:hypothetical protein
MPGDKDVPGGHTRRLIIPAMTGATADDEWALFVADSNLKVVGVNWVPNAGITHSASNYTTMTIQDRGAADGSPTTVASRAYSATDATAFEVDAVMALSATAANLLLTAGDVITLARAHTSSGLALPAGVLEVSCQYR